MNPWQLHQNSPFHWSNGRPGQWLLWLPSRLWVYGIPVCSDLELTQVGYSWNTRFFLLWDIVVAFKMIWETFRSCDSRNLNLEPLCTLETGTSPKLWLEQVIQGLSVFRWQAGNATYLSPTIPGWGGLQQDRQLQPPTLHQEHCQPQEKQTLWQPDRDAFSGENMKKRNQNDRHTQTGPTTYNAWEEDFAALNIFFGQETVIGEICYKKCSFWRTNNLAHMCKNWREASRWDPLSLSPPLADSLASSLASALSLS